MCAPNRGRDQGCVRGLSHSYRAVLSRAWDERRADRRLWEHPNYLSLPECSHRTVEAFVRRAEPIDRYVLHLAHQPTDALLVEDLLLRQEADEPPLVARRVTGEDEVQISDVVGRDDGGSFTRDVLGAVDDHVPSHRADHAASGPDDDAVNRICHEGLLLRR